MILSSTSAQKDKLDDPRKIGRRIAPPRMPLTPSPRVAVPWEQKMRYGVHQQYKGRKTGPGGRERVKDGQGRKTDDRKTGRGQMDRMVDRRQMMDRPGRQAVYIWLMGGLTWGGTR